MKPGNRHMRGANSYRFILKDEDLFYIKKLLHRRSFAFEHRKTKKED